MKIQFLKVLSTIFLVNLILNLNLPAQDYLIRTIGMGLLKCIAYSPDGTILASAGFSGDIYLWDVNSGTIRDTLKGHTSYVLSVAFFSDGSKLASGSWFGTIKLWDINTGVLFRTINVDLTTHIYSIAVSPDGSKIASYGGGRKLNIWDVKTGSLIYSLAGHNSEIYSVAFSPDGTKLVSGGLDSELISNSSNYT